MALYPVGTIFNDSMFQDQIAQAGARQQLAQNRSQEDETRTNYDYGLGTGGEANPFGQQQVLNRNQKIEGIDQRNQSASRPGGVRSGAFKVRNANMIFDQARSQDSLQRSFQNAQLGYRRQNEDIANAYGQDVYNAGLGSVQRKLEADQAAGLQAAEDAQTAELQKANAPANPLKFGATGTLKTVKRPKHIATNRVVRGKSFGYSLKRRK